MPRQALDATGDLGMRLKAVHDHSSLEDAEAGVLMKVQQPRGFRGLSFAIIFGFIYWSCFFPTVVRNATAAGVRKNIDIPP